MKKMKWKEADRLLEEVEAPIWALNFKLSNISYTE